MKWKSPKRRKSDDDQMPGSGLAVGQKLDLVDALVSPLVMGHAGPINSLTGAFFGLDVALSSATSKKGNTVGAGVSAVSGQIGGITGYYAGKAIGTEVGAIIGTFLLPGVGTVIGGAVGNFVGGSVGSVVGDKVARNGTQGLLNAAVASTPRVRFGGDFKDSQPAYTMRQKAEQELSGSLLNARRYLGREAQLMHQ